MRLLSLLPLALAAAGPSFAAAPASAPSAPAKPAAVAPVAAPAPKRGELWFVARAADGAIGYDAVSIKRDPQLSTVSIISLIYLKRGATTKTGTAYNFIMSEDTVDCIGPQFKPKSRQMFDIGGKLLNGGDALPSTGWAAIPPGSPLGAFRSVACSGATFGSAQQAPSLAAAMTAMKAIK